MSLDAGSVFTLLGFKVDDSDAKAYEARVKSVAATGEAAEGRLAQASARLAKARGASDQAAKRSSLAEAQHAEALAKTESQIGKTEKAMRDSGVATKLQAVELDHLTKQHDVLSSALQGNTRAMGLWAKNSDQASKNLSTLGRGGAKAAAVGILSLAAATLYTVKTAGDFERQMRNVNSIAKLNEAQYHSLSKSVLNLAGATAQSPKVLAEGLYQLVSSGFNASDSLLILKASAKAATAGLTDTATATTAVAAVLNAYRLPASEASHVSDILFETVNRGVLTFAELSKEIGTVLPFASALGVPLKDVGAAISTMTKEGISAPETMTRIKQAMVSIIKPSADMKKAIKETGASSGQALIEQRGFQGGLEALVKTTNGSKEALSKLFPNIRATGGVLALTGKNARSAQGDIKAFQDTTGATASVFAEQAKGAEFAGKEMITSLESGAIVIGDRFLPLLGKGARELAQTLQQAAKDGTLAHLGQDAEHFFSNIGTAAADAAPPIEFTAKALIEVAQALGLTNPGEIAALGVAFLAWKAASLVLPIVAAGIGAVTDAMFLLSAAAADGELLALPGILLSMANPVTAIAAAIAGAAGLFVAFESGLFSSASAAEKNAAALEADKKAVEGLQNATQTAAAASTAAQRATLNHKEAVERLKRVEKEASDGTLKGAAAQNALLGARLNVSEAAEQVTAAHAKATKALEDETHQVETAQKAIGTRQQETLKQIASLEEESAALGKRNTIMANGESAEQRRNKLQAEYNQQSREAAQANAEVAVSAESRRRIEAGVSDAQITSKNAQGVKDLQDALGEAGASKKVTLKYELEDQGVQAKLGSLAHQLAAIGQQPTVAKILTTAPNASVALLALQAVIRGVPGTKVISILHNAGSAKEAMTALHAAVRGVPASKIIQIESNASSEAQKVSELRSAINSLESRTVTVTTVLKTVGSVASGINKFLGGHASGRGAGETEVAVVGEGRGSEYVIDSTTGQGYKTQGPTLAGLSPTDYVVPVEDRYRGRALGLFAMLARDLNIPGYKSGRAPKGKANATKGKAHKPMPVPNAIPPLSLPLSDIESKEATAKSKYEKAAKKVTSLEGKIRTAERNLQYASKKGTAKAKDTAKLKELQAELRKAKGSHDYTVEHRSMQEWQRTLKEAKAFQSRINDRTLEANNAGNQMKLAAEHGDEAAYLAAKGKRTGALGKLEGLIREARKQVKTGSEYALQLEGQLQSAELETGQAEGEPFPEEPEAGLIPNQVKEQKQLEASAALAALTPGIADDESAAQQLVSFFENALSSAQSQGAGPGAIIELATDVKNSRGTLEGLLKGESENADVQAQINQANERAEVAKREADINRQALEVFGGSGDIGQGGPNARGAVVYQTINALHIGDPALQLEIANASASGFEYQGGRPSPRVQVGP